MYLAYTIWVYRHVKKERQNLGDYVFYVFLASSFCNQIAQNFGLKENWEVNNTKIVPLKSDRASKVLIDEY